MQNMSRQELIASLRRKSSGFSRGASVYRGVTRAPPTWTLAGKNWSCCRQQGLVPGDFRDGRRSCGGIRHRSAQVQGRQRRHQLRAQPVQPGGDRLQRSSGQWEADEQPQASSSSTRSSRRDHLRVLGSSDSPAVVQ
uniref:Uncharacterized protein n=1 Tax=Aegilops tauschii subsp. strangulata TaxID=200361 RepID=A0A453I7T1_AEGTS